MIVEIPEAVKHRIHEIRMEKEQGFPQDSSRAPPPQPTATTKKLPVKPAPPANSKQRASWQHEKGAIAPVF